MSASHGNFEPDFQAAPAQRSWESLPEAGDCISCLFPLKTPRLPSSWPWVSVLISSPHWTRSQSPFLRPAGPKYPYHLQRFFPHALLSLGRDPNGFRAEPVGSPLSRFSAPGPDTLLGPHPSHSAPSRPAPRGAEPQSEGRAVPYCQRAPGPRAAVAAAAAAAAGAGSVAGAGTGGRPRPWRDGHGEHRQTRADAGKREPDCEVGARPAKSARRAPRPTPPPTPPGAELGWRGHPAPPGRLPGLFAIGRLSKGHP